MSRTELRIKKSVLGFTLIELVIVASIIAVLVAISSPLFRASVRDLELRDAAYNLSKIIKYAQQRAVIEEKKYRLCLNFEKKSYQLFVEKEMKEVSAEEEGAALKENSRFLWQKTEGRFGRDVILPKNVEIRGSSDKITFLPNGRCAAVSIYLTGQQKKTIEIKTNGRAGYAKVSIVKE